MQFSLQYQESYSRSELLLRTFFGMLYIGIPHAFLLFFLGIWAGILGIAAFFAVLFTGRYPVSMHEYQVGLMAWSTRVMSSIDHLFDGYPPFGLTVSFGKMTLLIDHPDRSSRGLALIRLFFGAFYILIPHGFCLFFRMIATGILRMLAWWVVLFTGTYPRSWYDFNVGTTRWVLRVQAYTGLLTDTYPPFSGKE